MEREISRKSFVRLGTLLGVGAAGSSVLAACGGGSGDGASGGGASGGGGKDPASGASEKAKNKPPDDKDAGQAAKDQAAKDQGSGGRALARASDVSPGAAVKFKDGGQPAVLVHLDSGDFVAYSAVCTHAGCEVAYTNKQLACPCHGSVFDPANGGEVVSPPAEQPLQEIPVEVRGGEVFRA